MMNRFLAYEEAIGLLSKEEKIGQSFMPAAYINDSEEEIRMLENIIGQNGVGGICFFHSRASAATNFEGKKEVVYNAESLEVLKTLIKRYQKASKYPLLISIDAEWGLAMRIENTPKYPFALSLGAMCDQDSLVFRVGQQIGYDCREAGIHWNFAPVADININPDNPVIGYRSFGEDPKKVSAYATAFSRGLQSAGILTSAKHFPGHGDTATDSHLGMPLIDKSREQLFENELIPFRHLIENGVDSVMVGHLAIPSLSNGVQVPATISRDIIHGFLRETLGFDGIVISDALNMHSVSRMFDQEGELEWQAYHAGTDILCYTEHVAAGISAIQKKASDNEIEEHFKRVWNLKQKAFDWLVDESENSSGSYAELMSELAENCLSQRTTSPEIIREFTDHGFKGVAIGKNNKSVFLADIKKETGLEWKSSSNSDLSDINGFLDEEECILLALYPPKAKPTERFGLDENEIKFVEKLAQTRRVILYLFGNPYTLKLLTPDNFEGIWVAFETFEVFQKHAAKQFLENNKAAGVLPVSIIDEKL